MTHLPFQIGGQCACKRYVTGRRCDRCLSGYDNIRESDPDGCSSFVETTTSQKLISSVETTTSQKPISSVETTTSQKPISSVETTTSQKPISSVETTTSQKPISSVETTTSQKPISLVETTTSFGQQTSTTTSRPTEEGSSSPWLTYWNPINIGVVVIVVVIIVIVAVVCARRRRRRLRNPGIYLKNIPLVHFRLTLKRFVAYFWFDLVTFCPFS